MLRYLQSDIFKELYFSVTPSDSGLIVQKEMKSSYWQVAEFLN